MNEPLRMARELLRSMPLPHPAGNTDKNSRGTLLIAGSSPASAGAAPLSGLAALRAGAGKVLLAVPESLVVPIGVSFPEAGVQGFPGTMHSHAHALAAAKVVRPLLSQSDAVLVGPGFMKERAAQELARRLLDTAEGPSFVIDALSLTGLWKAGPLLRKHKGKVVITPHAGEMAQLCGASKAEISADPVSFAVRAAKHLHCVVVLKGATTAIAQPNGPSFVHEANIAGLATSGSGDVLAGLLAGFLARGATPMEAAIWSVYLHAQAGRSLSSRIGPLGFLARELPAEIPMLMQAMDAFPGQSG